jgi:hypothetical protein
VFVFKHVQEGGTSVFRQLSDGSPVGVGGAVSTLPVAATLQLSQCYYMSVADGMELKLLSIEVGFC